jgi:hypothetical protein
MVTKLPCPPPSLVPLPRSAVRVSLPAGPPFPAACVGTAVIAGGNWLKSGVPRLVSVAVPPSALGALMQHDHVELHVKS